jgi:hypothetical protein
MVEVRKFERITEKKHRRVVPHQVPVALLGVEFHGKAPDIPFGIGGAALTCDGRKTQKAVGLFTGFRKDIRLGVLGNVVGNGKGAIGAGALGVHAALGDHLPVEVSKLLQKPDILQEDGTARSRGHGILVINNGSAIPGGQFFLFIFHSIISFIHLLSTTLHLHLSKKYTLRGQITRVSL